MDRQTERQTGRQRGRQTDSKTDRETDRQTEINRQTDRKTDRQNDKPMQKNSRISVMLSRLPDDPIIVFVLLSVNFEGPLRGSEGLSEAFEGSSVAS